MVKKFPDNFIPSARRADDGCITDSELVAMAWDDETSFDNIKAQSGLAEKEIIKIVDKDELSSNIELPSLD